MLLRRGPSRKASIKHRICKPFRVGTGHSSVAQSYRALRGCEPRHALIRIWCQQVHPADDAGDPSMLLRPRQHLDSFRLEAVIQEYVRPTKDVAGADLARDGRGAVSLWKSVLMMILTTVMSRELNAGLAQNPGQNCLRNL